MRIFIIRHGDPDYSIDHLTEKGKREAELLCRRLVGEGITKIYCSPLGRAQATAKPTADALGLDIVTCDWLREFEARLPDHKGAPWNLPPRIWTADPKVFDVSRWRESDLWKNSNIIPYYDNVCEKFDQTVASHGFVRDGMVYHFNESLRDCDDAIAFFCHHGLGTSLIAHIMGVPLPHTWHTVFLPTSSVTTLLMEMHEPDVNTAIARVISLGDTSHLFAGGEPISSSGLFTEIRK